MRYSEDGVDRRTFSEAASDIGGGILMACVGFAFAYVVVKCTPVIVTALCNYLGVTPSL